MATMKDCFLMTAATALPEHDVLVLTQGGTMARILHAGETYILRITRQGKLILTK